MKPDTLGSGVEQYVPMPEPSKRSRLLVVDDEPSIRELLTASLRFAGFEVDTAAAGAEALQWPSRSGPTWSCST